MQLRFAKFPIVFQILQRIVSYSEISKSSKDWANNQYAMYLWINCFKFMIHENNMANWLKTVLLIRVISRSEEYFLCFQLLWSSSDLPMRMSIWLWKGHHMIKILLSAGDDALGHIGAFYSTHKCHNSSKVFFLHFDDNYFFETLKLVFSYFTF